MDLHSNFFAQNPWQFGLRKSHPMSGFDDWAEAEVEAESVSEGKEEYSYAIEKARALV